MLRHTLQSVYLENLKSRRNWVKTIECSSPTPGPWPYTRPWPIQNRAPQVICTSSGLAHVHTCVQLNLLKLNCMCASPLLEHVDMSVYVCTSPLLARPNSPLPPPCWATKPKRLRTAALPSIFPFPLKKHLRIRRNISTLSFPLNFCFVMFIDKWDENLYGILPSHSHPYVHLWVLQKSSYVRKSVPYPSTSSL